MSGTVISIGEILWDVFDHREELGGAPFNFAVHAARMGHRVIFLGAVGRDHRGVRARDAAARLGLPIEYIQQVSTPTGAVQVTVAPAGDPQFEICRPAAYDDLRLSPTDLDALSALNPKWLYHGTLYPFLPANRALLRDVFSAARGADVLYDINLREGCYSREVVEDLLGTARVLKLNQDEAALLDGMFGLPRRTIHDFCRHWAEKLRLRAIAVTRGSEGCALLTGGAYVEAPAPAVEVVDTVGAGDAFAAALLHGLDERDDPLTIAGRANRLAALVASRPGGAPAWTLDEISS